MCNVPTLFTMLRFIVAAALAGSYVFNGVSKLLCPLFILGAITDWLDGYLARLLKQQTLFGAFLDQFADKVLVSTALIILVASYQQPLIALPTLLIINREIAMSSLRQLAAEKNISGLVQVNLLGKIKTALQLIGIGLLLAYPSWFKVSFVYGLGVCFLITATLFAWISFFSYYIQFRQYSFEKSAL